MKIKKLKQPLIAIILVLFSFYYTNKSIEIIREADPIMKQIRKTTEKYQLKSKNAQIIGNKIIPGQNGKEIDYEKSYNKMKNYGSYNEALTTLKEVKPTISVNDYYDKYIVSGNKEKKEVALVFKINNNINPINITNLLKNNKIPATLFIDGLYFENNIEYIETLYEFELELLSYDNQYNELYFKSVKDYFTSITKKEAKYCYADYDKKEVIELCSKLKMHTITPTIKVEKYLYQEIKDKLTNTSIISVPINSQSEKELLITINYIKSKGYKLVTLNELLSEKIEK